MVMVADTAGKEIVCSAWQAARLTRLLAYLK